MNQKCRIAIILFLSVNITMIPPRNVCNAFTPICFHPNLLLDPLYGIAVPIVHHHISSKTSLSLRSPKFRHVPRQSDQAMTRLRMKNDNNSNNKDDIWKQQRDLINQMKEKENKKSKDIAMEKYRRRAIGLIADTAFASFIIFCFLWIIQNNPWLPISYLVGTTCGIAYAYGLSKYVETVGQTVDDVMNQENTTGTGFGAARFAFLIVLFVVVGKFRSYGLLEMPSIFGFFTYQLASISQGLRDIND